MVPIELIGAPQSVFVRAIRMAFEEKGVAYSLTSAAPHSALVNAIHPFGRIPVMRHGDFVLFESAEHLSRFYATHSLRDSFIKTTPPPMAELRR